MRRVFVAAAVLSLTAAVSTVVASPAFAASGPPGGGNVSCTGGSTCAVELHNLVHVDGYSNFQGFTNGSIQVPPPPCLWIPEGDAITGSNYIIGLYGSDPKKAPNIYQIPAAVQKSDDLLKHPQPGEWYWLPINPAAGQSGEQICLKLPAYFWAVPGSNPPITIPPKTVADYLLSGISKATVSSLTVNPSKNSIVNLPTFVTANMQMHGTGHVTLWHNRIVISLTAHVGNQPAVTAWIISGPLRLQTPDANIYDTCAAHAAGGGLTMGTSYSVAQQNAATLGEHIDCGVEYLQPSPGTFTLTASVGWAAYWAVAPGVGGLLPSNGHVVPGLTPSAANRNIVVQEVQSSNGG